MPIPTRSISLREPRSQSSSNGIRIATKTKTTTPTTATATAGSDARKTTLLPQRSSSVLRGDSARPTAAMKVQTQAQESSSSRGSNSTDPATPITHRRTLSQQQQQQKQDDGKRSRLHGSATTASSSNSAGALHRQSSLIKPSPLKTVSSGRSVSTAGAGATPTPTTRSTTTASSLSSPRKPSTKLPPPSPKKTDMPPPPVPGPRHTRSVSLRQRPSSTSLASPGGSSGTVRHTRHRSQISEDNKVAAKRGEVPLTPSTPSSAARARAPPSTSQQQFSPKKTPAKGSTPIPTTTTASAIAAMGSGPSLLPSSLPEIAAVQTDLLQLHLFHANSLAQDTKWQNTSEANLRKKYDTVASKYRSVVTAEKASQHRLNTQALSLWLQHINKHTTIDSHGSEFPEQIQLLSQSIREIADLTDDVSGRYTHALQTFDDWFSKAEQIRKCRSQLGAAAADDLVVFIDPLDREWRGELDDLGMKIELCARQFQSLDILSFAEMEIHGKLADASLFRIARGLSDLMDLMLDEISSIRRIERDIVKEERRLVSRIVTEQLASESSRHPQNEPCSERGLWMWRSALQA